MTRQQPVQQVHQMMWFFEWYPRTIGLKLSSIHLSPVRGTLDAALAVLQVRHPDAVILAITNKWNRGRR